MVFIFYFLLVFFLFCFVLFVFIYFIIFLSCFRLWYAQCLKVLYGIMQTNFRFWIYFNLYLVYMLSIYLFIFINNVSQKSCFYAFCFFFYCVPVKYIFQIFQILKFKTFILSLNQTKLLIFSMQCVTSEFTFLPRSTRKGNFLFKSPLAKTRIRFIYVLYVIIFINEVILCFWEWS